MSLFRVQKIWSIVPVFFTSDSYTNSSSSKKMKAINDGSGLGISHYYAIILKLLVSLLANYPQILGPTGFKFSGFEDGYSRIV